MRAGRTHYIVSYDVRSDARRRQVAQTLESYGTRIQYSVFRVVLSEVQRARLEDTLGQIVHNDEDQILLVRLGKVGSRREWPVVVLGRILKEPERSVVIVT